MEERTIIVAMDDSNALKDLSDVINANRGPQAAAKSPTANSTRQKVIVPQLALNKIELMFQADASDNSASRPFAMNSQYH